MLAIAPLILYGGAFLHGEIPLSMDTVMYFFPMRWHAAGLMHLGEWPWWNRCILGGTPLYSNPQSALGYPLNWPMMMWPSAFWFTFPMVLQLGLWSAATAWLLEKFGVGRIAAILCGAICIAGNYGWSRLQFGNYLNVLPWWPVWLGCAVEFARCGKRGYLAGGAMATAMMFLSGAHQPATYGIVGLAIFSLSMMKIDADSRRRWVAFAAIAFGIGVMIGAPGWLPQMAFLRETTRGTRMDSSSIAHGAFGSWFEILSALIGNYGTTRGDAEASGAIGLVALALAFIMPRELARRRLWIATWLMALATILPTNHAAFVSLGNLIPAVTYFHDPRRMLGFGHWALMLAAGLGAGSLIERIPKSARVVYPLLVLGTALLGFGTWRTTSLSRIKVADLLLPEGNPPLIESLGLKPTERFFVLDWQRATSFDYRRPDLADWALPNLAMLYGYEDLDGYEPAQSVRYRRWIEEASDWPYKQQPWTPHFGLTYPPHPKDDRKNLAMEEAQIAGGLIPAWGLPIYMNEAEPNRWIGLLRGWAEDSEIRVVYVPSASSNSVRRLQILGHQNEPRHKFDLSEATRETKRERLMVGLESKLRLVTDRIELKGMKGEAPHFELYLAEGDILAGVFRWSAEWEAKYKAVEGREFAMAVKVDHKVPWAEMLGAESNEIAIKPVEIRSNYLKLEATRLPLKVEAVIELHDAYWPGWRAYVDGKETQILTPGGRYDGFWRWVVLPASKRDLKNGNPPPHKIELSYFPPLLGLALVMCLAGIAVLAAMPFIKRRET